MLNDDDVDAVLDLEHAADDAGHLRRGERWGGGRSDRVSAGPARWPCALTHAQPLLHVQVRRRLVVHVDVGCLHGDDAHREALQLAAREVLHLAVQEVRELELLGDVLQVVAVALLGEHLLHVALDHARDLVHVLRLDHCLELVGKDLRRAGSPVRGGRPAWPLRCAGAPC